MKHWSGCGKRVCFHLPLLGPFPPNVFRGFHLPRIYLPGQPNLGNNSFYNILLFAEALSSLSLHWNVNPSAHSENHKENQKILNFAIRQLSVFWSNVFIHTTKVQNAASVFRQSAFSSSTLQQVQGRRGFVFFFPKVSFSPGNSRGNTSALQKIHTVGERLKNHFSNM